MAASLMAALLLAAVARAELSPAGAEALTEGTRALYSLEYEASRRAFRSLVEKEPDNPFGYLFESGAIWWQSSQEYGLFKDTPTLQGLFEQDVEAAIRKAGPWIDSKDPGLKADGLFAAGMALGTRGQWHLMKGHYLRAFLDGKQAIKHLKKCVKIDETYYDAYIGLGLFDYQTARLSGVARLGTLFGMGRGDEKRGLERLRLAVEKGRHGWRQAAQLLTIIHITDLQDWAGALELIERLRRDVPESAYFESLELLARWKLGEKERSFALGRSLFDRYKADPRAFERKLLTMVCGLRGAHCLDAAQLAEMRAWLTAAIEAGPEPAALQAKRGKPPPSDDVLYLSWLRLVRGLANDGLGKTDEAAADYRWVLERPDFAAFHDRARACLESGCAAAEQLAWLKRKSQE